MTQKKRPEVDAIRNGINRPIDAEVLRQAAPDPLAPVASEILKAEPLTWEFTSAVLGERADIGRYLADGWEPVSVVEHGFNECIYYFKRPKA